MFEGKPINYIRKSIANAAKRDAGEARKLESDRLGLKWVSEDKRSEMSASAVSEDDERDDLISSPATQDLALIAMEEKKVLELELAPLVAQMPEDQRALFKLKCHEGLGWVEARERLGLPQSVEDALRSRLQRYRNKRATGT